MAKAKVRELSPGITANPDVRFGKPVIAGTRVDVATVLGHLAAGDSVETVMQQYGLTRKQVAAALDYAARIIEDEDVRAVK